MEIFQIDTDGRVLRIWPSMGAASRELKLNKPNVCTASKDGSYRLVGGFYWRKSDSADVVNREYLHNVDAMNERRLRHQGVKEKNYYKVRIQQLTPELVLIREWDSIREACIALNINAGNVGTAMKRGWLVGGFRWRRCSK